MSTVFIGGSRRVGRLNSVIRARLDNIVERGLRVVIGDANGGDRAVQAFLAEKGHKEVVVYCMEKNCRNNVGGWPVHAVEAAGKRGFEYYSMKDAEMARDADCGFMIWDSNSKGTLMNIQRLVEAGKPVVVYLSPDQECKTVRTKADISDLLCKYLRSDRQRPSRLVGETSKQVTLFPSGEGVTATNDRVQREARARRR
jgi:hypothetical protein